MPERPSGSSGADRQPEVRCPICRRPAPPSGEPGSPHPFCSERCRLIDLGRWLDGRYQIPVEEGEAGAGDDEEPDRRDA